MSTLLEEETTAIPVDHDTGDHDRFAHYFPVTELDRGAFDGIPAKTLCGKRAIPLRDPSRYPICPACKDVYDGLD